MNTGSAQPSADPPTVSVRTDHEPTECVPLRSKLAAGSGEAVINIGINIPKSFSFLIYNIVLGVNPTLLGIALFIPRIWDALLDPLMGSISDNTRSRFGRRRPYMLIGGLLTSLAIALLCIFPRDMHSRLGHGSWHVSVLGYAYSFSYGDMFYAGWLMIMSIAFYTFMTIYAVPYGALTMEMTRDYGERTRVMSFRTFFTYVSGLLIGWLYAIAEADWSILHNPSTGERDPVRGSYAVGLLLAGVILVCAMLPTLFVREPRQTVHAAALPKVPLMRGLRETLRNGSFLLIVTAYTVGFLGVIMVIGLGQYVNFYHVYGGDRGRGSFVQGWAHTLAVCMGLLATLVINRLAHRVEKKHLLIGALCSSFVGGVLSWFLYSPDLPTWELRQNVGSLVFNFSFHPLAISYALIWPGLAGLLIMSNSMIADLCDVDELKTGARREGMYWAVFNWIQKTAISVALLFSGVILDVVGFRADQSIQTPDTIYKMRLAYLLVVCGGVASAAIITAMIPISRARMQLVREELDGKSSGRPDHG